MRAQSEIRRPMVAAAVDDAVDAVTKQGLSKSDEQARPDRFAALKSVPDHLLYQCLDTGIINRHADRSLRCFG
jgi:hypothetical protein